MRGLQRAQVTDPVESGIASLSSSGAGGVGAQQVSQGGVIALDPK